MQTHVLTCEVTALVTLLLCLCHIRKLFCKNTFLELVKGALAAVLLSLWFLVPFLDYYLTQNVHIRNVSARTIQDRGLYIAHMPFHFWTTGITTPTGENGMQYTHPGGVGLVLIIGLAVFLLLWYSGKLPKLQNIPTSGITFTKTVCLVALLLLFMSLNVFPWDRIQSMNPLFATLVSSLQFPNRFLGWGTLLLVMLFGFLLCFFREQATPVTPREPAANLSRLPYLGILLVAVLGITTSSIYLLDHILQGQDYFELYNQEGMGFGYISGAEYVIEGTDYEAMAFAQAVTGEGVELLSYEKGALRARIACRNTTARESWLDIPLLLYKGYQAVNSDTGEPMELTYGENNCIRVLLPAHFAGEISVGFVSPFYWRISEVITAAFVVFLAVSARRKWRKKAC